MPLPLENRKARAAYQILDTLQAGLQLTGPEVKSARLGQVNFQGAYVTVDGGQAWVANLHISPYPPARREQQHYVPTHRRRLLLRGQEVLWLAGKLQERGLTALPLRLYSKGSLLKLEIGLARGKRAADRREEIKKRDIRRHVEREYHERLR